MDIRRMLFAPIALLLVTAIACGDAELVTPDAPDVLFAKKDCEANPDDPRCGGKDDSSGSSEVTITLTGAATNPQLITGGIGSDSPDHLALGTGSDFVPVDLNFDVSNATCTVDGDGAADHEATLREQLTSSVTARFSMEVDRNANGQASDGHRLLFYYEPESLRAVRLGWAPGPVATFTEDASGGSYTYSGGTVRVWGLLGKSPKDDVQLLCTDHGQTLTVTVDKL